MIFRPGRDHLSGPRRKAQLAEDMEDTTHKAPLPADQKPAPGAMPALITLTLIYGVSQVDRQVIGLLLPDIKRDFNLSDTALGLLTGFAFAILYTISTLILSRMADKGNRRPIIAIGVAFYSVMTALSGLAQNVWQLTFLRFGVAVGEGSGLAPSTAMISDYFPPARRGRALGVFVAGAAIGTITMFPLVGLAAEHFGWRAGFAVAGAPGLLLGAFLYFRVKDPPVATGTPAQAPPLGKTLRFIAGQRSVLLLYLGTVGHLMALLSFAIWTPSFLARIHDATQSSIGFWIGLMSGAGGLLGSAVGGFIVDAMGDRRPRMRLIVPALVTMLGFPSAALLLFAPAFGWSIAGLGLLMFFLSSGQAALWATLHASVHVRMRALAGAISAMLVNIFALGFGPLIVGALNDRLAAEFGENAIRYSLLAPAAIAFAGSVVLILAAMLNEPDRRRVLMEEAA